MVTVNLFALLGLVVMFCLLFAAVGVFTGFRIGYLEGYVKAMNDDAMNVGSPITGGSEG